MNATTQEEQPQAAEVVDQVLADEQVFENENRRDHREPLVIPAQIHQAKFDLTLSCFVRNISSGGVCLIVPQPFRAGAEVTISLFGEKTKLEVEGTCSWGTKFGITYWVSGWSLNQQLPVGRMLKDDSQIETDKREGNRVTTAIPVYIKLPNSKSLAPGFTRNLSRDGICLVSKTKTTRDQLATLEVMRLEGGTSAVESRCLWAKRYGEEHWVSGWDFNV